MSYAGELSRVLRVTQLCPVLLLQHGTLGCSIQPLASEDTAAASLPSSAGPLVHAPGSPEGHDSRSRGDVSSGGRGDVSSGGRGDVNTGVGVCRGGEVFA